MNYSFLNTVIANLWIKFQETMSVLMFLKSLTGIHLTGSRFFGTNHAESDYDFFISAENLGTKNVFVLRRLGFSREWNTQYTDSDPTVVMVFAFHGIIDIHLQVIATDWYDKKLEAQTKIKDLFEIVPHIMNHLSKESMKDVWRKFIGF